MPAELLAGGAPPPRAHARRRRARDRRAPRAPSPSPIYARAEDALRDGRAVAVALHATPLDATDAAALVAEIGGNHVGARAARAAAAGEDVAVGGVRRGESSRTDLLLARLLHYGAKIVLRRAPAIARADGLRRPAHDAAGAARLRRARAPPRAAEPPRVPKTRARARAAAQALGGAGRSRRDTTKSRRPLFREWDDLNPLIGRDVSPTVGDFFRGATFADFAMTAARFNAFASPSTRRWLSAHPDNGAGSARRLGEPNVPTKAFRLWTAFMKDRG